LVEDENLLVLVDQHLRQDFAVALRAHRARRRRPRVLAVDAQRRHADDLPGVHAAVGLHAAAVHTDLSSPQQLLQLSESKTRIMYLEPAIEAHARFAIVYLDLFYASHIVTISA